MTNPLQQFINPNFNKPGVGVLEICQLDITTFTEIEKQVFEIVNNNEGSEVNTEEHATKWTNPYGSVTQYNLISASGKYDDFSGNNGVLVNKIFNELVELVSPAENLISYRINILNRESGLSQHKETTIVKQENGKLGLKARFHLPIKTNKNSGVFLNGNVYQMQEGRLYYFNNACIHSAYNHSEERRIHLVFDVMVSEFTQDILLKGKEVKPSWVEIINSNAPLDGEWNYKESDKIELV